MGFNSLQANMAGVDEDRLQPFQCYYTEPVYPCSIVWCPIPFVTYLLPLVGHVAITKSNGTIWDFSESHFVTENNFSFGVPKKYLKLDIAKMNGQEYEWDKAIDVAAKIYSEKMHCMLWSNCHSFVCEALNQMQYDGHRQHTVWSLLIRFSLRSRYVRFFSIIQTWWPQFLLISLITIYYFMISIRH